MNTIPAFEKLEKKSPLERIEILRKGFPFNVFTQLADALGIAKESLAASLALNIRTLRRNSGQLNSIEAEKIFRVFVIYKMATRLWGAEQARDWLLQPAYGLGQARPLDLLDTDTGAQTVSNLLRNIEWSQVA
ncbi:MAG: antitoxin Xre/MbcA/ParS toxin-binding domain-containing protein [Candidatus Methylacidiphilales bacterium]